MAKRRTRTRPAYPSLGCTGADKSRGLHLTSPGFVQSEVVKRARHMVDSDLRDQITQLEADIEQLAETLERCRKAMLLSKLSIGVGAVWMLAYLVGAVGFVPAAMVGAIAAIIGGIVVFGSNSTTSKQTMAAMKDAETLRTRLIDRIDPRTVAKTT
jgi:hypothetical protein